MTPATIIAIFIALDFMSLGSPHKYPCETGYTAKYQPANGYYEVSCIKNGKP